MRSVPKPRVVLPIVLVAAFAIARGSETDGLSDRKTFVVPRKNSRWQDRTRNSFRGTRSWELRDGDRTLAPRGVGYVYKMERRDGERLRLLNRTHSLRGWALATDVVQLDEAEAFFSREIEANPKSPFAHLMRGFVRYENDDPLHSLVDVDEALRLDPKYAVAWNFHAFFWQCKKRLDLAMADVNKAIELDPEFSAAFVARGFFHCLQNQFDDALHDFDRASDLGSRSVQIDYCRGVIDFQRGALDTAEGKFDHVLKIDPNRCDAWLRQTGDFEAAICWQMKAIEYLDLGDPGEKDYRDILECYYAKKPYHSVGRFMEMGLRADVKRP